MGSNKWNKYYMTRYQPIAKEWSKNDVEKYKSWYFSWLKYIENRCNIFQKKANIIEIGSGIGAVAISLHDQGHKIMGSDISDLMVKYANKFCYPVRFLECDIQKGLPRSSNYDVIMGLEVLEHLPKLSQSLRNIYSSLRTGGFFIGTSPYPYKKNYSDPTHVNVKYPEQWVKLFRKYKFSDIRTYPMSFFPFLWRLNKRLNVVLPFYTGLPLFVSMTLIIAKK